ncbi:MAG: GUN4 domain-containing protein [Cyanobacteria bacterium P01_H01_bin.162]
MAKIALLIGTSDYGEALTRLPGTQEDLQAMQRVLEHPDVGAFDKVEILPNPNRTQMELAIETLFTNNRSRDDLILLYFSGHGVRDDNGVLYFAVSNTQKSPQGKILTSTAVSSGALQGYMGQSRSKRQVLILDCCFSGAFARDMKAKDDEAINVKAQLGGEGRAVMTSSTATQVSYEKEGASLYTTYLVQGLETGAADKDGNGQITADKLHEYALEKVQEQTPTMQPEIYAVREGYKIFIARAPQGDPKLAFRKEVDERAKLKRGKFSPVEHRAFKFRGQELKLSPAEAKQILDEILQPYQAFWAKLDEFEACIQEMLDYDPQIGASSIHDLQYFQRVLKLRDEDITQLLNQYQIDLTTRVDEAPTPVAQNPLPPPKVIRKELAECDPAKILFLKNIRDPKGGWSYTVDHIGGMGGDVESRVFEIYWLPKGRGAKTASKGDLMLLNQHAKITHVVEMLDDDVRENEAGYFRWVRVVWLPDVNDWSQLPHQRDIFQFDPPTIGGGTAYTLSNLNKLQTSWDSLEAFQKHVFRVLTGAETDQLDEAIEVEFESDKGIDYSNLRDLLKAGKWKEADQETVNMILKAMGRKAEKRLHLTVNEVHHFPCKDLRTIDQLWVHFSHGKFGFSVQKQIWVEEGGKLDYGKDVQAASSAYEKMCARSGWRLQRQYISYSQVTFDASAPRGHLPFMLWRWGNLPAGAARLFSRVRTCKL